MQEVTDMKKLLSLALVLCLLLAALPVSASAYTTVLSPQNLTVDGEPVACEKYNIDGSNYFKLRDIAFLLMGSPAEFGVGWDAAANSVLIAPGMPYEPVGGELTVGEDRSASAVPSAQSVWCLDAPADGMSVYNIGGNNFFKLRDLGTLLGFTVDFDPETNTAVILTGGMGADPQAMTFDALWRWVEANAVELDLEGMLEGTAQGYAVRTADGAGNEVVIELAAVDTAAGRGLLLQYARRYADGSRDCTGILLKPKTQTFDVEYDFYPAGSAVSGFTGTAKLRAPAFSPAAGVTFDSASGPLAAGDAAAFSANAAGALGEGLSWLEGVFRSEPDLSGRSIAEFGFDPALLSGPQASAFDTLWQWVRANGEDAYDGNRAYRLHDAQYFNGDYADYWLGAFLSPEEGPYLALGAAYYYDAGDLEVTWLQLNRLDTACGVEYSYYYDYSEDSGDSDPGFFATLSLDPAAFRGYAPLVFETAEPERDAAELETSGGNAARSIAHALSALDAFCAANPDLSGCSGSADFGFGPEALRTMI